MARPCVDVWQTSNLRWLRLGEQKNQQEERKKQDKNIMSTSATQGGHNKL